MTCLIPSLCELSVHKDLVGCCVSNRASCQRHRLEGRGLQSGVSGGMVCLRAGTLQHKLAWDRKRSARHNTSPTHSLRPDSLTLETESERQGLPGLAVSANASSILHCSSARNQELNSNLKGNATSLFGGIVFFSVTKFIFKDYPRLGPLRVSISAL